jgi:hypothetical protein
MFMPLSGNDADWQKYLLESHEELRRQRMAKMPDLARHLGIDVEQFGLPDPANGIGLMMLYAQIALDLASQAVPGFQEKPRGKHPREVIRLIRKAVDVMKENGKVKSDLDACRNFLKFEKPDLARPHNQTELEKKAESLCNLISKDRANAERAESALHKKPRLRAVK